jgi:hypothetical protein
MSYIDDEEIKLGVDSGDDDDADVDLDDEDAFSGPIDDDLIDDDDDLLDDGFKGISDDTE